MYTDFGSSVTIFQDGDTPIPREDSDISLEIKTSLEKRGVTFNLGSKIAELLDDGKIIYEYGNNTITDKFDAILVATGRKANTEGLCLELAGVETNSRGAITVDKHLATSCPHIWALGDVTGGLQFTYVSLDDYRIIHSNLTDNGSYTTETRSNVPYSVFISPSFSRVGINEKEALAKGKNIRIVKMPASSIPKAQVLNSPMGILKAIIDNDTNKILGAMLFCEQSYEMINIVKLAMDLNADYTVLRDLIFTHPTMSESLNYLFSL